MIYTNFKGADQLILALREQFGQCTPLLLGTITNQTSVCVFEMLRGFDDPDELTRITLKPGRWLALNLFCKLGHAKQDFTALCHPDSVTSKWDEGVGLITDSGLVGLFPPEALAAYDKLYNSLGDDFHNRICHFGVYTTDHMYPDAHLKLVASLQDSGMNGLNSLPNGTCIITGCPQSGKLRVGRDAAGEPSCILLDWR